MLNKLPQLQKTIVYNGENSIEIIEYINSYIEKNYCESITFDISTLNIIDSIHVTTLCSTKHYIKYPKGEIRWIVSSTMIQDLNKDLELGNSTYILKQ